jgi:hypothetical protein
MYTCRRDVIFEHTSAALMPDRKWVEKEAAAEKRAATKRSEKSKER